MKQSKWYRAGGDWYSKCGTYKATRVLSEDETRHTGEWHLWVNEGSGLYDSAGAEYPEWEYGNTYATLRSAKHWSTGQ